MKLENILRKGLPYFISGALSLGSILNSSYAEAQTKKNFRGDVGARFGLTIPTSEALSEFSNSPDDVTFNVYLGVGNKNVLVKFFYDHANFLGNYSVKGSSGFLSSGIRQERITFNKTYIGAELELRALLEDKAIVYVVGGLGLNELKFTEEFFKANRRFFTRDIEISTENLVSRVYGGHFGVGVKYFFDKMPGIYLNVDLRGNLGFSGNEKEDLVKGAELTFGIGTEF